jgi:hypothetical protein
MVEAFISFSESLWRGWLSGTLDVPQLPQFVKDTFRLDAAPEPYICFDAGPRPLVALLTNPGYVMDHQHRANVQPGGYPLSTTLDYSSAARALGSYYKERLKGAAGRRIDALLELSRLVDLQGVLQVEVCPFHSRSLSRTKKDALLRTIDEGGLLGCYTEHLTAFLQPRPVVILSAVSTSTPVGMESVTRSSWLTRVAKIAGLVLEDAKLVRLVAKNSATTAAALVSLEDGIPKALVLMMGGNYLPAEKGLRVLAEALQITPAQVG